MADDVYHPEKTPEYEQTLGCAVKLGEMRIQTPHGPVRVTDAPGISSLLVTHPTDADWSRVAIMVYEAPGPGRVAGFGMVAQLDATRARTVAASLLRLAAQLDGGRAN